MFIPETQGVRTCLFRLSFVVNIYSAHLINGRKSKEKKLLENITLELIIICLFDTLEWNQKKKATITFKVMSVSNVNINMI